MKKMNFNTRAYVTKNEQLMIRVRWNSKRNEVAFSVGYTIDPMKWDSTKQLVKANTTHYIGGKTVYAREINNAIRTFLGCIEEVFTEYSLHNEIPGNADFFVPAGKDYTLTLSGTNTLNEAKSNSWELKDT